MTVKDCVAVVSLATKQHTKLQSSKEYSVSQKILFPVRFSEIFSQRLRILKQNFTRLLYPHHMYGKLQNFSQLSLNLSYAILSTTSSHGLSDAGLAEGRPTVPTSSQRMNGH